MESIEALTDAECRAGEEALKRRYCRRANSSTSTPAGLTIHCTQPCSMAIIHAHGKGSRTTMQKTPASRDSTIHKRRLSSGTSHRKRRRPFLPAMLLLAGGFGNTGPGSEPVEAFIPPWHQGIAPYRERRPLTHTHPGHSQPVFRTTGVSGRSCQSYRDQGPFKRGGAVEDGEEPGSTEDKATPSFSEDSDGFAGTGLSAKEALVTILGVNPLTLLLAFLAAGMLTANAILGPGWLRPSVGLKPTTFQSRNLVLPLDQPGFLFPKDASLWGGDPE
ncbi:hypothetical protein NSK_004008 [Nannochloropsis salina CCMP1776]|uniref:Uncharacterized protein n=1 Tax=Nannochloropsis salina CCMP1776 TaxID=1027361 RepID=A0A4D9CYT2_9STRA|nr:hypothetical protein NSK_004008 [Nannochloropsis salina CCMP1776]|eukprot:TFJ84542.1 hypothetical protein NSK_004008 [Nannochloropsis salina CCMP1776]